MDGLTLKEIELAKERTTIGRKPHNDIQIDNLAISGEHAVVITILNDSFLEDLGSTNGTFVNGQAIKKHFLQNGDTIELGKYHLRYVNEAAAHAAAPDFERTMILRPGSVPNGAEMGAAAPNPAPASAHTSAPKPTPTPAPASAPPPSTPPIPVAPATLGAIQVLSGANAGKELELTKSLTTLGKPGVQVAVIARRPHGYFITHVEGAVFPVVNGATLDAQAHLLVDHDIIEIAGTKMEFFLKT
jgi:predicted component of type VI protein secretion system